MKYGLICAVIALFAVGMVAEGYRKDAENWKRAYETELEIRSNLDELLKEFRSVCAER
jgi:hypothetical protein